MLQLHVASFLRAAVSARSRSTLSNRLFRLVSLVTARKRRGPPGERHVTRRSYSLLRASLGSPGLRRRREAMDSGRDALIIKDLLALFCNFVFFSNGSPWVFISIPIDIV